MVKYVVALLAPRHVESSSGPYTLTVLCLQINAPIIFERLKELRRQRNEVAEVSDLKSRVHFTLKEGRLFRILDKITRYNQKLTSLLDMSDSHTSPTFTVDKQKQRSRPLPRVRLRPFVRDLYNCMGQLLPCDCEKSHETRLCLLECPDATNPDSTHVVLNMLMLIHGDVTSEHPRWLESRLHIHLDRYVPVPFVFCRSGLLCICDSNSFPSCYKCG